MEAVDDLKQHLGGLGHAKLDPKHERVIMLLGAIAGIVGLFLLLRSHENGSASVSAPAITTSAGNTQGIGSSAGAYAGSLPFGTSQDTSDILGLLQSGVIGSGVTQAGSAATPAATINPPANPLMAAGSPAVMGNAPTTSPSLGNSILPPATPFALTGINTLGPTGAGDPLSSILSGSGLSSLLPTNIGAGSKTTITDSGNTTFNFNDSTTTINNTTLTNSGNTNSGNSIGNTNTLAGGAGVNSLPVFSSPLKFPGGTAFPIGTGGGIVIPPPIGITPTEPTYPVLHGAPVSPSIPVLIGPARPIVGQLPGKVGGFEQPGGGGGHQNKYGPGGSLVGSA